MREAEGSVQPRCGHAGGLRDENVCLGYLMRAFGIVGDGSEGDTSGGAASGRCETGAPGGTVDTSTTQQSTAIGKES